MCVRMVLYVCRCQLMSGRLKVKVLQVQTNPLNLFLSLTKHTNQLKVLFVWTVLDTCS